MRYLRATKEMLLTLEADSLHRMCWWVAALFAVHPDMKSHTGGVLMMRKGAIHTGSTKQKLNTRSSTEVEIVGVDDLMPQVLWTRYFMEAQGYKVSDNIVYQDNESAIRLKKTQKDQAANAPDTSTSAISS